MQWAHAYIMLIVNTSCFSSQGTGSPVRIQALLRKEEYIQIFDENLKESEKLWVGEYWKFKEDNGPKHTAKVVQKIVQGEWYQRPGVA